MLSVILGLKWAHGGSAVDKALEFMGATLLSIMTFSITTLSITPFSILTFSIMRNDTQHEDIHHNAE